MLAGKRKVVVVPFAILGLVAIYFAPPESRLILFPMLAATVIVSWTMLVLWDRDGRFPLFDLGAISATTTLLYMVFPLITYLYNDLSFTMSSDSRLWALAPTPEELGSFHWRHVLLLFCLCVGYLLSRRTTFPSDVTFVESPPPGGRRMILLVIALLSAGFFVLYLYTGFRFSASYAEIRETGGVSMPLIVRQLANRFNGILFISKIALVLIVVQRSHTLRWRAILLAWMGVEVVLAATRMGARNETVMLVFAAALAYHRTVKPLSATFLAGSGAISLWGFLVYGMTRDHAEAEAGVLEMTNEFQVLLGTSYDMYQRKLAGNLSIPWYIYFNDVIALFPPRQILPFTKMAASHWYLTLIGIKGSGIGLMWGVITQALIGLDWFELVIRGAGLAYLLARIHRWYSRAPHRFFATLTYLFLCVRIYNCYRSTTLAPFVQMVYEFLPALLLIKFGGRLLELRSEGRGIRKVDR